jgi:hypothetical protein
MLWLKNPIVEIAIAAAINRAPVSPSAARMTADAGAGVAASPAGPSARKQTAFTAR